jgi:cobalt-zinc-cadmium efflux system outer membrane protein
MLFSLVLNHVKAATKLPTIEIDEIYRNKDLKELDIDTYLSDLDIDKAVKITLIKNPELRSDLQKLGVAEAELIGAKLFSNPQLAGELMFFDRNSDIDYEIEIQKEILDIFFRPMRKSVGEAKLDLAKYQLSQIVLNKIFETKAKFLEYVFYLKALELKKTSVELTELEAEVAQRQNEAGNINPLELYSHNLSKLHNENKLADFNAEYIIAKQNFLRVLALNEADLKINQNFDYLVFPTDDKLVFDDLINIAFSNSPELKAIEKDVLANQKSLKLAKWRALPEFSLGGKVLDEPGPGRYWGPTISAGIPIFDRNQDQKAFYKAMLEKTKFDYEAQKIKLYADIKSSFADLEAKREIALRYKDFIFEQRQKLLKMTQLNYNFMLKDVYDLLHAKKNLVDAEITYLEALKDYYQNKFEILSLIGLTNFMESDVNEK